MKLPRFHQMLTLTALSIGLVMTGCQYEEPAPSGGGDAATEGGSGTSTSSYVVTIDGSSTVYPISQAVAEEIKKDKGIEATVGTSGTGGGFDKFSKGETDISDASRPIKDKEKTLCADAGIEYIEVKVGVDGLSVVVNPENDWCDCLSVAQLKKLWENGSTIKKWNELDPSWPDEEIKLFGPDEASGTFDYFNEEIIGDVPEGQSPCRTDYTPAVNDNVLVNGVKGNKYALGYFGYAYYIKNQASLKALGIANKDDKSDCVAPTPEAIENGSYTPLSRPLFIYINKESLKTKPEVATFVEYYLENAQTLVPEVGYVNVSPEVVEAGKAAVAEVLGH